MCKKVVVAKSDVVSSNEPGGTGTLVKLVGILAEI
jgi:hypothetical protein